MFTWKRITTKALIIMILFTCIMPFGLGAKSFAESYATAVDGVSVVNSPDIYEGDEFVVQISLNGIARRLSLVDQANFKTLDGATSWTTNQGSTMWTIRLVSLGKENELKIKVTPIINTDTYEFVDTISIPGFKKSAGTATSVDTFSIPSQDTREVIAGSSTQLEVPVNIQNTSTIKNVTMTIISPKDESLFKNEGSVFTTTIASISKAAPSNGVFKVNISPSAKSKLYDVKFQFKYTTTNGASFIDETNNTIQVRVRSNQMEPNVNVVDYSMGTPLLAAGQKQTLTLKLGNTGTIVANDIRVKLSGFDKDKVRLSGDSDTKSIDLITGKQNASVSYSIAAATTAKSESNELSAEITYIDDNGKEYKATSKIYIQVDGKDVTSVEMAVLNLKSPDRVKSKESFSIEFDLKNTSQTEARMVEVGLEYANTTLTPKSTPKKIIRVFKAGQVQHFKFDFMAKEEALTGFSDLYVNVKYNVEGGKDTEALSIKEFAGVFVDGAVGLGRPKVIIENYDFGGTTVLSGQEFDLALDLFNTSSEESIKNIKVSLKADDGVFAPVDMSSSFFIERIGAQERVVKIIRMKTKSDATVKAYNLLVTFQYEDSKGNAYDVQKNPYKEEETITIPVNQPIRIETGEVTVSPENYLNQPTPVSMEFFNMGRSIVYNLMVKAEGDFQVQGGNYFVGNFEAGRSDFFEAQVMPTVEGEAKGKIIFIYEDANGEPGIYEKEFTMNVLGAPVDPGVNPDGTPTDGGVIDGGGAVVPGANSKMMIIGILIGITAIFGGVGLWKRKLEKKKAAAAEEGEDE